MADTKITVRSRFSPDVHFSKNIFVFGHKMTDEQVLERKIQEVLEAWESITGLAWSKMAYKVHPQEDPQFADYIFIEVPSPLTNCGSTMFWWKDEK